MSINNGTYVQCTYVLCMLHVCTSVLYIIYLIINVGREQWSKNGSGSDTHHLDQLESVLAAFLAFFFASEILSFCCKVHSSSEKSIVFWVNHLRELLLLQFPNISWLVVDLPLWKMMEFVSWDDYSIPNLMESHKSLWFQTTNQY